MCLNNLQYKILVSLTPVNFLAINDQISKAHNLENIIKNKRETMSKPVVNKVEVVVVVGTKKQPTRLTTNRRLKPHRKDSSQEALDEGKVGENIHLPKT